jgi:anti-sigma regulatory factor (Ser/Thr protein kinase)
VRTEWSLQSDLVAPSRARELVASHCSECHPDLAPEAWEVALLLVTELVTNAVLHGAGPVVVSLTDDEETFRVDVSDGGAGLPAAPHPADPWAEGGRGLMLVEALAASWGVRAVSPAGKVVWFELGPLEQRLRRTTPCGA